MTLVKTNREYFPTINSLFDDFFGKEMSNWGRDHFASVDSTLPSVNIKETADEFNVEMAAPGLSKKDFNVSLENQVLTISSERTSESDKQEEGRFTRKEFSYQSFSRSFTLPETADVEKIAANYTDGLLSLRIPKKEEAKPKGPKTIKIS